MQNLIYESGHLRVFVRAGFNSKVLIVTFSAYADRPGLEQSGFGEFFLAHHQLDAIHVVCATNAWYQYPDIDAALAAIRAAIPPHAPEIVTYGQSMGGYAAINFADLLGARRAVAFSPQYSLDPAKISGEIRWMAEAQATHWQWDRIGQLRKGDLTAQVLYDDRNRDLIHITHMRRTVAMEEIVLPHTGHPVTGFLHETGLLSSTALDLLRGEWNAAHFQARLKTAQSKSGVYLLGLHAALPPHHIRLHHALLRRAEFVLRRQLAENTSNKDPWLHLGLALAGLGRRTEAIAAIRTYLQNMDYLWARFHLGRLLLDAPIDAESGFLRPGPHPSTSTDDSLNEGLTLLSGVLEQAPQHWEARMTYTAALERCGYLQKALTHIDHMIAERPTSLPARALRARLRRRIQHPDLPQPYGVPDPWLERGWRALQGLLRAGLPESRCDVRLARTALGDNLMETISSPTQQAQ